MSQAEVLEVIEELSAIQGVRGSLIATANGAFAGGQHSGLESMVANDIAKTVRRMTVASATVGAPLEELTINFGAARMLIVPLREDAVLVVMLERDTATRPVRSVLDFELPKLKGLLEAELGNGDAPPPAPNPDDEVTRLMEGELGPVLRQIESTFSRYTVAAGASEEEAAARMRTQLKEWLLCCNPSNYTFPLLLDGLSQTLNDAPDERAAFTADIQNVIKRVGGEG